MMIIRVFWDDTQCQLAVNQRFERHGALFRVTLPYLLNCLTLKMKALSAFEISVTVFQFMRHKYPRRRKYSLQYLCELAIFAL